MSSDSLSITFPSNKTEGSVLCAVSPTVGDSEEREVPEHRPILYPLDSQVGGGDPHPHVLALLPPQLLYCGVRHPVVLGQGAGHFSAAQVGHLVMDIAGAGNGEEVSSRKWQIQT